MWSSTAGQDAVRVLPDGCMDFLWSGGDLVIAGPDTHAHLFERPFTTLTGLRFAPGFAPRVIGVPACEFTNTRVPLADVWTARDMRRIVDELSGADDPGTALEDLALRMSGPLDADAALIDHVVERARDGEQVSAVANVVGLSSRQLHRRCLDAFGYGAKTLTRVLRMVNAVELARSGVAFADTAARTGYADQAHFARDVKQLAGVPLGQLVSVPASAANRSTELPSGSRTEA